MTAPPPTRALDVKAIHEAIDKECSKSGDWRRARSDDVPTIQRLTSSPLDATTLIRDGFVEAPLFYALVNSNGNGVAIFFVEFSTWEGRVVFMKRFVVSSEKERSQVMRLLANTALALDCVRLVWQHTKEESKTYKEMGASTMDEVLTLKMDRVSMTKFTSSLLTETKGMTVNDAMDEAIQPFNMTLTKSKLQLKRATADDLPDIRTLIQGLADHVKESDAVKTTENQLRLDGFETTAPLYHCLMLNDVDTSKACGVAIIFFGYDTDSGRFLYLEDLFIEEAYRGRGGGKSVMLALASIAQMLDCGSFVWQALDWNTPSLDFYNGIGARIQDGLLTSRFVGSELEKFAMSTKDATYNREDDVRYARNL